MRPGHRKSTAKTCIDCRERPRYLYGRCQSCFNALDPTEIERLRRLTRAARAAEIDGKLADPGSTIPHFEWPGDEEALAAQYGQNAQQ